MSQPINNPWKFVNIRENYYLDVRNYDGWGMKGQFYVDKGYQKMKDAYEQLTKEEREKEGHLEKCHKCSDTRIKSGEYWLEPRRYWKK